VVRSFVRESPHTLPRFERSQFLVMLGARCSMNCAQCWAALLCGDSNPCALPLRSPWEPFEGFASGLAPRMGWNSLCVFAYQLHALL